MASMIIWISWFVVLTITALGQEHTFASDTLAVVGTKCITLDDFQKYYNDKIRSVGLTDNGEARQKYLENLLDDQVLLQYAYSKKIDKEKNSAKEFERIKTQALLNAFSKKHLEPEVTVSEDDIRLMYIRMSTKVRVRHLYASSLKEAEKLYDEVKHGKSFEELAPLIFQDPVLKNNGGDLGYISVDDMDPAFEEAAYTLKPGEISHPVKTVQGYSIIKVEDVKPNPLLTETEYLKSRGRIKAFVQKRAYEKIALQYTEQLKKNLKINFNSKFLEQVYASWKKNDDANHQEMNSGIYQSELKRVVVTSAVGNWTAKKLIDELEKTDEAQRLWIHSVTDFEDLITGLLTRFATVKKALAERLDASAECREETTFQFESYLIKRVEEKIKKENRCTEDEITAYYVKNKDRFTKPGEMRLSSILVDRKSLADSLFSMLESGLSFENLSSQFSIQKATAEKNGDMGFFKKEELGTLGDQVFSLRAGEWLGPLNDEDKFVFLKCTEIKGAAVQPLQDVHNEIANTLDQLSWFKVRQEFVDNLKRNMVIKVFPEKLNSLNLLTKREVR